MPLVSADVACVIIITSKLFLLHFEAQNVKITAMSKKKCLKLGWRVRRRMFSSWEEMHQEKKTMAPHQRAHLCANDAVE